MQLSEDDNPSEDDWLLHWVSSEFRPQSSKKTDVPYNVGLAVSGGSDSMAMLHLFARAAKEHNYKLSVATVDHGLRPESKDEAAFVARTCAKLGLIHTVLTWTDWDGKGNLQAMARDARYELLADWSIRCGLDTVTIGHTLDDKAETFIARLARGSGLDGLSGMQKRFHRNGAEFSRPCLSLEREMLRRFLRRHGMEWKNDPSNEDLKYQRVAVRQALKTLKPLGIDIYQISHTAHNLSLARNALTDVTRKYCEDFVKFEAGDLVIGWVNFVCETPHEIQRRMLGLILRWLSGEDYAPRADALYDLQKDIGRGRNRTLAGCLVSVSNHDVRKRMVRFAREPNALKKMSCETRGVWDGRWKLDGPHATGLAIRPLGEVGLKQCPDWKVSGLPRTSLLTTPAIWRGEELIAAPLAKLNPEWTATLIRDEKDFFSSLVPH